jgi:hypothetical protein
MRAVDQRRDIEPINEACLLQEGCRGALTRSLTKALHDDGAPLAGLIVVTRFNARDRERREHPQDHRVLCGPIPHL